MGVVKRQSFKSSLVRYFFLPIGLLSTVFIYPYNEQTHDAYGHFSYIFALSSIVYPFLFLGIPNLAVKYFPVFQNTSEGNNGFLKLLFYLSFVVLAITGSAYLLISFFFAESVGSVSLGYNYHVFALPISICIGFTYLLRLYISNFKRIVVPDLLENLKNRTLVPMSILLVGFGVLNTYQFLWLLLSFFVLHVLSLLIYLRSLDSSALSERVNKGLFTQERRPMIYFALFSMLGAVGSTLCSQIDSVMISQLVDVRSNGTYAIGKNIANIVLIPAASVFAIMAPIIAGHMKDNRMIEVDAMYKRSSNVLFASGLIIFLAIIAATDDLIYFMNRNDINYDNLYIVITFLGASTLFNLVTSINSQIIIYSKFYRFNVLLVLFLGLSNILLNYVFIVILEYNMIGAVFASSISLLLFDLLKFGYVYYRFKLQPFKIDTLKLLLLGVANFVLLLNLDFGVSPILNIILKECIFFVGFVVPVFTLRLSPEINDWIKAFLKRG